MPARVFVDIYEMILKFMRKGKETGIAKTILEKKNKVGGISLANFKTWYTVQ